MWHESVGVANRFLWRFDLQLCRTRDLSVLGPLFYQRYHQNFTFVQVGANDGRRSDPIHDLVKRHNLAGLAIEPLPDMFVELTKTYQRHPKVKLANIAVHRTDSAVTLHRVRPGADVPDWAHGIASLNPRHHELSRTDAGLMVQEVVPAAPLTTILAAHHIHSFDLFLVDTEGYDAEIVRMLLESEFRPKLIVFEHGMRHSIMTSTTFWELGHQLMNNGYYIATQEYDAIAYRR